MPIMRKKTFPMFVVEAENYLESTHWKQKLHNDIKKKCKAKIHKLTVAKRKLIRAYFAFSMSADKGFFY